MNNTSFKLFQIQLTQQQLDEWMPLSSSVCDPNASNCGPTALSLMNVIPRPKAEYQGEMVKESGISIEQMQVLIMEEMKRIQIQRGAKLPIDQLAPILKNELNYGNITLIFLYAIDSNITNHVATIARDLYGRFYLLEGQKSTFYEGNALDNYLRSSYVSFECFYSINKYKRSLNDLINPLRKNSLEVSPSKKQKISGGKIAKKRLGNKRKRTMKKKPNKFKKSKKSKKI